MYQLFILGLVLALTSCAHEVNLQASDGRHIGKAELKYEGNSNGSLVLNKGGVIYQGAWMATKVDESSEIAKHYGIGSRKYQNYLQGKANYLKSGKSILKSESGDTLVCEFMYKGASVHGWCTSDAEIFEFMTKS